MSEVGVEKCVCGNVPVLVGTHWKCYWAGCEIEGPLYDSDAKKWNSIMSAARREKESASPVKPATLEIAWLCKNCEWHDDAYCCHRFPPQVAFGRDGGVFVKIGGDGFCGEFRPKAELLNARDAHEVQQ